ncbi:hypothetical protein B296_00002144, partial [Ensete ventricosum]
KSSNTCSLLFQPKDWYDREYIEDTDDVKPEVCYILNNLTIGMVDDFLIFATYYRDMIQFQKKFLIQRQKSNSVTELIIILCTGCSKGKRGR